MGERSPYWNPQARGALVGLAMPHGQAELARAVLEGVALNLGLILEVLRAQNVQVDRLLLIGGGARSAVWRQILADVLDLPVWLPALTTEATALGALVAAGIGVGLFPILMWLTTWCLRARPSARSLPVTGTMPPCWIFSGRPIRRSNLFLRNWPHWRPVPVKEE